LEASEISWDSESDQEKPTVKKVVKKEESLERKRGETVSSIAPEIAAKLKAVGAKIRSRLQEQVEAKRLAGCEDDKEKSTPGKRRNKILPGITVDKVYVTEETMAEVQDLADETQRRDKCPVKGCEVQMEEHAAQHYIVYGCSCGFISSNRDSVTRHIRRAHPEGWVFQADEANWGRARRRIGDLPRWFPRIPMRAKPTDMPSGDREWMNRPVVEVRKVTVKELPPHPKPKRPRKRSEIPTDPYQGSKKKMMQFMRDEADRLRARAKEIDCEVDRWERD
jgi:hypothetical protein